ncbi:MAG TPA: DUF3376 domain-containing protein [Micromonosporaceae bacterium]|nr:DUF3376 domain-containing protein [Micromonosporaceae bacterium]
METYGTVLHEVRLALVLNGGLSLAVWMGGVTHEIDQLRRASQHGPDSPAAAFWKRLCDTYQLRVIVDIVAGTSAGGLNGTLLASAAATDKPMPQELRQLWIEEAALTEDRLLKTEDPPQSLLNGAFLQKKVKQVTGEILSGDQKGRHPVTLFITATGLGGKESSGTDSQGQRFQFEDHRRLYRFAFDPYRLRYSRQNGLQAAPENDLDPQGHEALSVAARASASFPLAFAPVSEEMLLRDDRYRVQPEAPSKDQPSTHLMDGGVLDNAPFGPVLKEMLRRPITGPYRRILGYVVPSSGLPKPAPLDGSDAGSGAGGVSLVEATPRWTDVVSRALNLPREVDFRSDVDELDQVLSVASESSIRRLYRRMRLQPSARQSLRDAAMSLRGEYRRAKAIGGVWQLRYALGHQPMQVSLQVPPAIDPDQLLAEAACRWLPPADVGFGLPPEGSWPWGLSVARQAVLMMLRDTQEALHAPQASTAMPQAELPVLDVDALAGELSTALAQVDAVATAVQQEIHRRSETLRDVTDTSNAALADLVDELFDQLDVAATLSSIVSGVTRRYAEAALRAERHDPQEPISRGAIDARAGEVLSWALAAEILSRSFATPSLAEPAAPMEFVRIGPDVTSPYPPLSGLECHGEQKLFGTKLGHFGGFARSDARERDWRWGRLDAAAHLTRMLLPHKLSADEVRDWICQAQEAVLRDEAGDGTDPDELAAALVTATNEAARKSDRVFLREILCAKAPTADGAATGAPAEAHRQSTLASSLAKSAVHLLTHARLTSTDPTQRGWQTATEAAVGRPPLSPAAARQKLLRWLATDLRQALWRTLDESPTSLARQLGKAAKRWVARHLALAALTGALLATSVTALAYGDRTIALAAAALLVAGAFLLALGIWVVRPRD